MNSFLNVFMNVFQGFIYGMAWIWEKLSTPFFYFGGENLVSPIELLSWTALVTLFTILVIKLFI